MSTLVPLSHSPVKMFSFLFLHRVKEKIRELAKSPSLSVTYIKNEVHKFSHTLVDHLNIGQDSTQFFPNEPAIKKIMRQFREALRLDPHDHIACSMYTEQDEAANPGPWLMQVMPLNTSKPQSVFFVFLVPQPRTSLFSAENKWFYRQGDGPDGNVPMLLVHQTPFQQKMMAKYGGTIVGMDATYKTNLWGLPLLLIVVVDNHGHGYPIASAFIQSEEKGQLSEVFNL